MNVSAFAIRTPRTNAYLHENVISQQIYQLDLTTSTREMQAYTRPLRIKMS